MEEDDELEPSESFSIVEISRSESAFDVGRWRPVENSRSFTESNLLEIAGTRQPSFSPSESRVSLFSTPIINLDVDYMKRSEMEDSVRTPMFCLPLLAEQYYRPDTRKSGSPGSGSPGAGLSPTKSEETAPEAAAAVPTSPPKIVQNVTESVIPPVPQLVAPYKKASVLGISNDCWSHILGFLHANELGQFAQVSFHCNQFAKAQPVWLDAYKLHCFLNVSKKFSRRTLVRRKKRSVAWRSNVVLVGPAKCGKTCFVQRFGQSKFSTFQIRLPSRITSQSRVVNIDGKLMKLVLWDTPEINVKRVHRFRKVFHNGKFQSVFICFDVSNPKAYDQTLTVLNLIKPLIDFKFQEVIFLGLKADLKHQTAVLQHIQQVSKRLGCQVHLTSSKTGKGVFECVKLVTDRVVARESYSSSKHNKNCSIM